MATFSINKDGTINYIDENRASKVEAIPITGGYDIDSPASVRARQVEYQNEIKQKKQDILIVEIDKAISSSRSKHTKIGTNIFQKIKNVEDVNIKNKLNERAIQWNEYCDQMEETWHKEALEEQKAREERNRKELELLKRKKAHKIEKKKQTKVSATKGSSSKHRNSIASIATIKSDSKMQTELASLFEKLNKIQQEYDAAFDAMSKEIIKK